MTSDRKIAANRLNGRRSRGPRTAGGRAKSSKNALRHGLSVRTFIDHTQHAEIDALARAIAGEGAHLARHAVTRIIAEAQFDLDRVQAAKLALINSEIAVTRQVPPVLEPEKAQLSGHDRDGESEFQYEANDGVRAFSADILDRLIKLERYERRARSSRRQAMRAFRDTCEG